MADFEYPAGDFDAQGVWQFGEGDAASRFSDTLNIGQKSISQALAVREEFVAVDKFRVAGEPDNLAWDRAVRFAAENGYGRVVGASPVYEFAAPVELSGISTMRVAGAGMTRTRIRAAAGAGEFVAFRITQAATSDVTIADMEVVGGLTNAAALDAPEILDGFGNVVAHGMFARNSRTFAPDELAGVLRVIGDRDPEMAGAPRISNISIENVKMNGISGLPVFVTGVYGHVKMTGCHVERCLDPGFTFNESVTFSGNHSRWSADSGVSLSRGNANIVCTGNDVFGPWLHGIFIGGFEIDRAPENVVVTGNTIYHVGQNGIWAGGGPRNVSITGNTIRDCQRGALNSADDYGVGVYISGWNAGTDAAPDWHYAEDVAITGNVFEDCARGGVNIFRYANAVSVVGNIFRRMGTPLLASGATVSDAFGYQNFAVANPGPFSEWGATVTNVSVQSNLIIDERTQTAGGATFEVTRWATWHPGITSWSDRNNIVVGVRNAYIEELPSLRVGTDTSTETRLYFNGASASTRGALWTTAGLKRFTQLTSGTNFLETSVYEDDGVAAIPVSRVVRGNFPRTTFVRPVQFPSYPATARPSASGNGAGATFYDTTLHKLLTSDGAAWRDQSGTAV